MECKDFLELWLHGDFEVIKSNFANVPDSVFFVEKEVNIII